MASAWRVSGVLRDMTGVICEMRTRRNEPERVFFRSDRFFSGNGQWYFETREGVNHGPFDTREEAEQQLEKFLQELHAGDDAEDRDDQGA